MASAPATTPQAFEAPAFEPSPYVPPAYEPRSQGVFGSTGAADYAEPGHDAYAPVGVDAPEHPVDIDDNLNWELEEAFTEAAPEEDAMSAYEAPSYPAEHDRYGGGYSPEPLPGYAARPDSWDEPAPVDLDDMFAELADAAVPEKEASYPGGALAAAAAAGLGSRAFEPAARFAQPRQPAASSDAWRDSPHRDPVVRGNPMKEDPLDIITQLAEKYSRKEPETPYGRAMSVAAGTAPAGYYDQYDDGGDVDIADAFEEPPEVETIEVGDHAIALADDLDIPELPEEDDLPPVAAYDDLDSEFSSLLSEMNAEQAELPEEEDPLLGGFSARPYETKVAAAVHGAQPARSRAYDDIDQDAFGFDARDLPGNAVQPDARFAADDYQYDPDLDQDIAAAHPVAAQTRGTRSRGLMVAGLVGGVALIGAIGAFALSFGGGDDAPAIVRADDDPVKVRPENPGGATVPNQDSKVYETVAGDSEAGSATQQEKLVSTTEEPVDVMPSAAEDTANASGKSEDRIEQILEDAENKTDAELVAVAPRKVRTMVVKPDGTLVPREDEPETAAAEPTQAIAAATPEAAPAPAIPQPDAVESTGALPEAQTAPEETTAAEAELPAADEGVDDVASMPDTVPIAPLRPADQPIDVVGEVQPDQVAAATATAAASSGWAMQIASQPSQEAAQASYQNLLRRYGAVLEGREVNIVKAEISGKGTFWRVRVPANSRNEAIGLCENYKAAGGNCFVSR
ncbi:SPOR domain-containing protein [Mesorhizobium marinum]|uniref:SPOR domain-containing protein n=1 Tax=Mesorhizobium marinum TaxID=3228790 RepID=UPI003467604B